MAISLYSGFVPVCFQLLGGLKTVLQKAEEHATAQKWDTATVLNLRLYPDMFTLELALVHDRRVDAKKVLHGMVDLGANNALRPPRVTRCGRRPAFV